MLSQRDDDAIDIGVKRTLSAIGNELADSIDKIRKSNDSALAESLLSYTFSVFQANHVVVENA